jgi:16S rRNA (guanine527-N7)-methyltransferase
VKQPPLSAADVAALLGINDRRLTRLQILVDFLGRWQASLNLVSAASLEDAWRRHILDSAQLAALFGEPARSIIDLGSGAGFPGLVLAIVTDVAVTLVESDQRKAVFLREAARVTNTAVTVANRRAETLPGVISADIVTARAVAPLPMLLRWAQPLLPPHGRCLLLKGRRLSQELTAAEKEWRMQAIVHPSRSDPDGMIVELRDLVPRHDA